ncbi:hypothetical protein sce2082 [Sorangium cellulosum So ce56]|uniref:eCIS core domain-containing protein n=1 Tax=Sorangium cellulosum (strain So ce56) TaxID=448385 RepID=A9FV62_SORC5|nr:DUF4157 domain-containing protein [Sorangium cellulosum]CAN92241.1 hypothetical protein sce2082 [Sorangium cellulosum So ce56]
MFVRERKPIPRTTEHELPKHAQRLVQRRVKSGHSQELDEAPSVVTDTLRASGEPLDAAVRAYFEPRFGHDFGQIRVHTDARAAKSAAALQAVAYTFDRHIVFGAGQYSPSTREGRMLVAHELAHAVQQSQASPAAASPTPHRLVVGPAGGVHEQEADATAARVIDGGGAHATPSAVSAAPVVQRKYINNVLYAVTAFSKFIENAKKYGLPTKILERIKFPERTIELGNADQYNPVLNTLSLRKDTLQSVENMAPTLPFGESSSIQTIYHESTHAILDLLENDPKFAKFIKAGVAHYQGAPTTAGKPTNDPERVFQEAAASYVGGRVASWWSALECLTVATTIPVDKRAKWVARCRKEYDSAMTERIFGYSYEGIWAQLSNDQTSTTRAISEEMKTFMDQELLEGKIPDSFASVSHFVSLEQEILKSITSSPTPP